jgi:hypothetical protein
MRRRTWCASGLGLQIILVSQAFMQGKVWAVTYEARHVIPLLPTEHSAMATHCRQWRLEASPAVVDKYKSSKFRRDSIRMALFGWWRRRLGSAGGIVSTTSHVVGF